MRVISYNNNSVTTSGLKERRNCLCPRLAERKQDGLVYANEADMLNLALFGVTAKQWQEANPTLKGNIRDYATAEQLLVLANLENLNAHFIKEKLVRAPLYQLS